MRVIDLMCGLGARSIGFARAGFQIVCAVDGDRENAEIYRNTVKCDNFIFSHLEHIIAEALPDADIISSIIAPPLNTLKGRSIDKTRIDEETYRIISIKRPKCFLLEAPVSILSQHKREYVDYIMWKYIELGYKIAYNVFSEGDYSNYPLVGKQLYFVGLRKDISNDEFYFTEPQREKSLKEICIESEVDEWYRKIPFEFNTAIDYHKIYFWYKRELRPVKEIHTGYPRLMFVCDDNGLRRLTHNELAFVKGLEWYNYNKCSNKERMYRKIASSSNVYLIEAIGRVLFDYLSKEYSYIPVQIVKKKKRKKKEPQKVVFPKHIIKNINVENLKGIKNLELNIERPLTAIMGVNGAGKSTIIHALACVNAPYDKGDEYKFSFFFTPNSDFDWSNSKLSITYRDENLQKDIKREYKKGVNRWSPRYVDRPKRDVYYLGIETCIPEIEKERQQSFIKFSKDVMDDETTKKVVRDASYVLNKDYTNLTANKTKKKELLGVNTRRGLGYSSLSMGAGEQRVLKILKTIHSADTYSLILIDEIDVLLHTTALKRLVKKIYDVASKRNLQIIFTTHSLEILKLKEYVDVRYIQQTDEKTMVYDYVNSDMIYHMSNEAVGMLNVYVEDTLAECIVRCIASEIGILGYVNIVKYGSISNAFVLASSFIFRNEDYSNVAVVLDGDDYVSIEQKKEHFKKYISGTEENHKNRIECAVSIMKQFALPLKKAPEEYIFDMLVELQEDNLIIKQAKTMNAVDDSHDWLNELTYRFGHSEELMLSEIIRLVSNSEKWGAYTMEVREWLLEKKNALKLD